MSGREKEDRVEFRGKLRFKRLQWGKLSRDLSREDLNGESWFAGGIRRVPPSIQAQQSVDADWKPACCLGVKTAG